MTIKIQTGEWDGLPIYRWKTAHEQLIEALNENELSRKLASDSSHGTKENEEM